MKYVWIEESPNTASNRGWKKKNRGSAAVRDQIVKKNKCGTTGRVEEHFLRHVQGSGWRGSHRRSLERLFRGLVETKKPPKMHLQGSERTSTDGGWLDGVRRGWRWKRVAGKCSTRPSAPARKVQATGEETRVADAWLRFSLRCFDKTWRSPPCALDGMVGVGKGLYRKVAGGEGFLTVVRVFW